MWKTLHHPNVLPLLGAKMANGQFEMVSEWMINGNINEFIEARREVNRFELVRLLFYCRPRSSLIIARILQLKDIVKGLIYMHGEGMIHGDLKGV